MSAKVLEVLDQAEMEADARRCRAANLNLPVLERLQPLMANAILPEMYRFEDQCTVCGMSVQYLGYEPLPDIQCCFCMRKDEYGKH